MISFVDIPLNKLRRWSPSGHYGCLGIAFTDAFSRRVGIRRVSYYQYPDLARDPLVRRLNRELATALAEREYLYREIVQFRKPARFWPEFNKLMTALRVTFSSNGATTVEKTTYSRYEIGYDFEVESEARKVMSAADGDLEFLETDVLAVITPDLYTASTIGTLLTKAWKIPPRVMVYPK